MKLRVKDLCKSFGSPPTDVIRDVSFEVGGGEFMSLTGKSGSGKSTLLYMISTLDHPTSGSVEIDGVDVTKLTQKELHRFRNRHMGFIFQFHYLLPEFTVLENVLMPAVKAREEAQRIGRARDLIAQFDLSEKLNHLPGQLSGGQQQRVAIARALLMEPDFVFADEPTGALDSVNGKIVMDIFERISKEKTTVIYVTHDSEFAEKARRKIRLKDGRIVR
ncbi:MAG: ABC transporter ATP-binding protein [Leptospirales bacterium]|nr:ABC transporter ATP-binding protein [Leptospirales bacterium]